MGVLPSIKKEQQPQAVPFLLLSELELFCSSFVQNLHFLNCLSRRFWLTLRYLVSDLVGRESCCASHLGAAEGCFCAC